MGQISKEQYQQKAALRQASYVRKKTSATQEKGLIIVHTGPGKGKTTAALGKEELIDLADLVTEMRLIKHPYQAGIKAQRGVEF